MGDLEKRDLKRPNGGDTKAVADRIRVDNRVAELDRKIIEENVEGWDESKTQLPLAAAAVSVTFAAVVIVCYLRFWRRSG